MATTEEIAWAAGLFEGEGCISHIRPRPGSLQLAVTMTDEEIVRRFDEIVDRGRVYGPYNPCSHGLRRKDYWRWVALDDAGHDVVDLFAPWLGARRRRQAHERGVRFPGKTVP